MRCVPTGPGCLVAYLRARKQSLIHLTWFPKTRAQHVQITLNLSSARSVLLVCFQCSFGVRSSLKDTWCTQHVQCHDSIALMGQVKVQALLRRVTSFGLQTLSLRLNWTGCLGLDLETMSERVRREESGEIDSS